MIRYMMVCFFAMSASLVAGDDVTVPVGTGANGVDGIKIAPVPCVQASVETVAKADGESPAVKVTFTKTGDERRLLALEGTLRSNPTGSKVLAVRYRLNLDQGELPRLALVAYGKDGNAWFKVAANPIATGGFQEVRLPLKSLRPAKFSRDEEAELQWDKIEKVWFGLAIDGPAKGTFEVSKALFTSEPYRPTKPLGVKCLDASLWSIGKDPAAKGEITIDAKEKCARFDFSFPGGRHMYDIPSVRMPEAELEGYKGLRFTYKAQIPKGIHGLLVMLRESDGTQYCAEPPPPASKDWKTVTIPFASFKRGGWSKDENNQLDLDQVSAISIGVHGTTTEKTGKGFIMTKDIQFVP
ncbi:MAG: hypothetical protein GXP25_12615 [Planctomycetes bacterium]|nr:hypothetical protein [Planctomycetota bacterium]